VAFPSRTEAFVVFAQRTDARMDIDGWNAHAMRFFGTRIGLTTDPAQAAGPAAPLTGQATFVVAPHNEPAGMRSTFARPGEAADYARAEAADARAGGTGLALLARRCGMVWLVVRDGQADALALRLAAILASVLLGPILDEPAGELFGVKTARAKLESQITRS
jgi:hypothetical protein